MWLKGRHETFPTEQVLVPVHSKVLKPKDVKEAYGPAGVHFLGRRLVNCRIDLVHNPHEETPIDALKSSLVNH